MWNILQGLAAAKAQSLAAICRSVVRQAQKEFCLALEAMLTGQKPGPSSIGMPSSSSLEPDMSIPLYAASRGTMQHAASQQSRQLVQATKQQQPWAFFLCGSAQTSLQPQQAKSESQSFGQFNGRSDPTPAQICLQDVAMTIGTGSSSKQDFCCPFLGTPRLCLPPATRPGGQARIALVSGDILFVACASSKASSVQALIDQTASQFALQDGSTCHFLVQTSASSTRRI